MSAKPYFMTLASKRLLLISLALSVLMVLAAGCNLPGSEPDEAQGPIDPDAQRYRMYYDSSSDPDENELQIRYFDGQIRMADTQVIFGDTDALPTDENGNYVGGPILEDGLLWSLTASPSNIGVILISSDLDGTLSSAIDLDGDEIADIVDIWLGDGRRFTFVTEGLGMGVFEGWLLGKNPLCNIEMGENFGFELFGCGDDEDGGGEGGSAGGVGGTSAGPGHVDPLDQLCADYNTGVSARTLSHGATYARNRFITQPVQIINYVDGGSRTISQIVVSGEDNNYLYTTTIIRDYVAGSSDPVQETREHVTYNEVDGGNGWRVTQRGTDDGGSLVPIRVTLRRDATYDTDAPRPGEGTEPRPAGDDAGDEPGDEPPPPPPPPPDTSNPGPEGDDSTIADLCSRIENFVSGVEQAAATDPTAFGVSCNDLVGAPAGGDDCTIIDWARPGDFKGALEPGKDDGCDEFYERGPGGDCEPTSTLEMLRGRTALIASINFEFVPICPPIVCNPELFDEEPAQPLSGDRQEISASSEAPGPLVTETPTPTPEQSSVGIIPEITICYFGPGAEWGTVSSLIAGLEVEIIGIGEGNGWLIVVNPNFEGVTCWVDEDDVEVPPNLELGSLPEFEIPPLPEEPPEEGGGSDGGQPDDPEGPEDCADDEYWSDETESCEIFG